MWSAAAIVPRAIAASFDGEEGDGGVAGVDGHGFGIDDVAVAGNHSHILHALGRISDHASLNGVR